MAKSIEVRYIEEYKVGDKMTKIGDIVNMSEKNAVEMVDCGIVEYVSLPEIKSNKKEFLKDNVKVLNIKKSVNTKEIKPKVTNNKYEDTKTFIEYLDHKNYWIAVFRPDINGEYQQGGPLENSFLKSKKLTLELLKKYDGRGLACLAINEHDNKDQSIKSINRLHSLIIDIDVQKNFKEGFVSIEEHHELAISQANNVKIYLEDKGFKVSLVVDSGNGAHIYIYLDEKFEDSFIQRKEDLFKEYKDKLKIKTYKDEFNKLIKQAWEEQHIYQRIVSFESELKKEFKSDILAIDNITKDINRRMKVPGVINKKDMNQKEDRVSKILYYNENFRTSAAENSANLNKYEITEKILKESVKTEIIVNVDLEILKKFNKVCSSPKNKELVQTYKGENLSDMFGGDRSNAEQSLVNLLVFRGFHTIDNVDFIMSRSGIGKWVESPDQYKTKTFNKAMNLFEEKKLERESRKNGIVEYFSRYQIYLLMDEPKTKYIIYDKDTKIHHRKDGDDNLSKMLHVIAINNDINLKDLFLFYFESRKAPQNLLLDFLTDNKIITTINDISFKPTNQVIFKEEYKEFFNTYIPNEYLVLNKSDKVIDLQKECPSIDMLLNNITGNDLKGKYYLINLLAFMIQNPHIKTGKLIVLFGEEAAGKGIFYSQILKQLFSRYARSITGRDLDSPYNGYLSETIVLYINEVNNKKEHENTLKNWITEEEVSINNKYGTSKVEKTFFTIFADVNGNNPITAGERRGVYFKSKTLGNSQLEAPKLGKQLVDKIPKEINLFAQYLTNHEGSYELVNEGYDTLAKKDILDASKTLEDKFLDEMFSYSNFISFVDAVNNYADMKFNKINTGEWFKDEYIEVHLFLKLFNAYRRKQQVREITMHRFNWFYDKIGVNREDKKQFTRRVNDHNKNVWWLNHEIIQKKYDEVNEWY